MSGSSHPGRAMPKDQNLPGESHLDSADGDSLVDQSMTLTDGLRRLVQENKKLKDEVRQLELRASSSTNTFWSQQHDRHSREIQQRYESDIMQLKEQLEDKESEVDSLKRRLAAISERKMNQDQRMTENTLSSNRQSDLEVDFINTFKDGKRVDATEIILKKLEYSLFRKSAAQSALDHLKASRLSCLIFEVSYECARATRENFSTLSSSVVDTLINKAPSIAFLDVKKPVCSELITSKPTSNTPSLPVQDTVRELMVHVRETAVSEKLDIGKLVQTVKQNLQMKWKSESQKQKDTREEPSVPPFDEKLMNNSLKSYIDYCCRFAWRIVTQLPPMKIAHRDHQFDPKCHTESHRSATTKKANPARIKCFLWPILLDCDGRVIAKGEVVLS